MSKSILTIALFLASSTLFAQKTLPDISLSKMSGEKISLSDYAENGKITVFSFWATWCAPCKKELSNISDIYEDWLDLYNVEVVAINVDDSRASQKIKSYVDGQAWDFDVLLDPNQDLKRSLNFQTIPHTIMLNQQGEIVYEHTGYVEGDEYELEDEIDLLSK